MTRVRRAARVLAVLATASCRKAPLHDVGASFDLADVSWFADEQTLFAFYSVSAEQGLNDETVVEITYTTDDGTMPWTALADLPSVHTHVDVDCGAYALCGSASLAVPLEPRDVLLRLRYHRDGDLALEAPTVFNGVGHGDPWHSRSLLVYGVLDETNSFLQWRSRNQFPTLRNEEVEGLGLRRDFLVHDPRYGSGQLTTDDDPYGYGVTCPGDFVSAGFGDLETTDRAAFYTDPLPTDASDRAIVCADATVTDATGTFTTGAVARKNPEVRGAFPVVRSPVDDATQLPFFLGPCDRTISEEQETMQRQRLLLGDTPTTCIDDWQSPGFVDALVSTLSDAIEAERPNGRDMVLMIALNQDEEGVADAVEDALVDVVPPERERSSPRVVGAFVFDSESRTIASADLAEVALWCPATVGDDDASATCAILPDTPSLDLGPFSFASLPILPSRDQYLEFIDQYSAAEAGQVQDITIRAPQFAGTSDHVEVGDYGVVTFLNDEHITADPDDAFSYCAGEVLDPIVFTSDLVASTLDGYDCAYLGLPSEACDAGVAPLEWLPAWHNAYRESSYDLGIFWEFPFLLRMDYEAITAGQVSAFGFSVPFGFASTGASFFGTETWLADEFDLSDNLLQCQRFCDLPTFDSAGVYHVSSRFRTTYANACYVPVFPKLGDSGFPLDP